MPVPVDLSNRGPGRWGLRARGVAAAAVLIVAGVGAHSFGEPDRAAQAELILDVPSIGDGVDTATQVRMHGLAVGTVQRIAARGADHQVVTVAIDQARLPELSSSLQIRFVSANVFGTTAIELIPKPGGTALRDGSSLDYRSTVDNYTVTNVLRGTESILLDVVTPQLSDSLNNAADLMAALAPGFGAAVVTLRATQHVGSPPLDRVLNTTADAFARTGPIAGAGVSVLHGFLSLDLLDVPQRVDLARRFMPAIIRLLFGEIANLAGAAAPLSPAINVLDDYLDPLTHQLRAVSPTQLADVLDRLDRAFARGPDGRVSLHTEVQIGGPPPAANSTLPEVAAPAPPQERTR
ncbi:MlaD family protein [Nocardia vaccinii]|uniref:MlaD family protein n=1 Tax=Nocardia vaccinii TaxID=1822 RepID=UPI000829B0F3|nr:MlaD family protein [Nocardia vaccinii]